MEIIRRRVRNLLGYDSRLYRLASTLQNNVSVILKEGFRTFLLLQNLRQTSANTREPELVKFRRLRYPLLIRPGTEDIGAVTQNIIREEYGQFDLDETPITLIDAGAYIGDTSAYFLSRFPALYSIALEPNPESYRLAKRNLAPYGKRVTLLPFALSISEDVVCFSGDEMGARIESGGNLKVKAITVSKVLEMLPNGRANILKMDIEGAEDEIFRASIGDWLPNIDCIIIETHGPDIRSSVLDALRANGWNSVLYRNLCYCMPMK
jgi:FkbM family methyltransferase